LATLTLPNNWTPRDYQRKVWYDLWSGRKKRALLVWHRRAGKDDVCLHLAAAKGIQRPGNYWHMLPEYEQARKSVWNAVNPHTGTRRIDEAFPPAMRKRTNDSQMLIEFVNGAIWQLVGSDNYNSLVGSPPVGVTASEWALANPAAWGYLSPILRENGGWAVFITTPRGKNHCHRMYEGFQNDPAWLVQRLSIHDTAALEPSEIEDARREYITTYGEDHGKALFEQEYLCSFEAAILGAYYGSEINKAKGAGRIGRVDHDPMLPVHTVWDLGWSDDTVILFYQVLRGEVRVIDHYEANGHDLAHYASILREKGYQYGKHWLPHDAQAKTLISGGKSALELLAAEGVPMKNIAVLPNKNTEQQGIMAARGMFPKLWIDSERCAKFIDAISLFQREWDDERKCFKEKPKKDWTNHNADALRYLAWVVKEPAIEKAADPGRVLTVGGKSTVRFSDLKWDKGGKTGRI
jgi:phage terminase large subunit